MKFVDHFSAKPSHYNKEAHHYDAFNEKNSFVINELLEKVFNKYRIKNVLDLSCGTGSQVFWLAKKNIDIIGYDINLKMLKIAKSKSKKEGLSLRFLKGDMRTTQAGEFDAVITIFNSIGHLTQQDFEVAIRNIYKNLKYKGLYIFDIFNLSYLLKDDNITKLTIDWQTKSTDKTVREIQYSTINENGILASYDIYHEQKNGRDLKISQAYQTLQVYRAERLRALLEMNGFEVLRQCDIDGSRFYENKTERILTVAVKT